MLGGRLGPSGRVGGAHGLSATLGVDMLVLTRKSNQSIMIGDDIEISVLSVMGDKVRIGIQAPQDVPVFRTEIYTEIQSQRGSGTAEGADVDKALRELGEST